MLVRFSFLSVIVKRIRGCRNDTQRFHIGCELTVVKLRNFPTGHGHYRKCLDCVVSCARPYTIWHARTICPGCCVLDAHLNIDLRTSAPAYSFYLTPYSFHRVSDVPIVEGAVIQISVFFIFSCPPPTEIYTHRRIHTHAHTLSLHPPPPPCLFGVGLYSITTS